LEKRKKGTESKFKTIGSYLHVCLTESKATSRSCDRKQMKGCLAVCLVLWNWANTRWFI